MYKYRHWWSVQISIKITILNLWMGISMLRIIAVKQSTELWNSIQQLERKPYSLLSERSMNSNWIMAGNWSSEWRIHENDARRLLKNMKLLCSFWITSIIYRLNINQIISIPHLLFLVICKTNKKRILNIIVHCLSLILSYIF